jgi:tRNA 5-methylaminomethyl-2-thiouridine biosynthesis bifunctional protein
VDDGCLPASRIDATVLHGRLLADGSTAAALRCHAYLYAESFLRPFREVRRTGVLQLPGGTQHVDRLQAIVEAYGESGDWLRLVEAAEAADLVRWPVSTPGLWLPDGGVVDTPGLCRALLDHPRITLSAETVTGALPESPLVLACGPGCQQFEAARYLEVAPVHGQLDLVAVPALPAAPIVGNGYLAPVGDLLATGATYEYRPWDPEEATRRNLAQLGSSTHQWRRRIRGTRSVSSDRLPVAGHLYGPDAQPVPGLLVSTGHGSMGTLSSHLAGAVIAAILLGDFPPMTRALEAALSPLRFRERQARRGMRHGARA